MPNITVFNKTKKTFSDCEIRNCGPSFLEFFGSSKHGSGSVWNVLRSNDEKCKKRGLLFVPVPTDASWNALIASWNASIALWNASWNTLITSWNASIASWNASIASWNASWMRWLRHGMRSLTRGMRRFRCEIRRLRLNLMHIQRDLWPHTLTQHWPLASLHFHDYAN